MLAQSSWLSDSSVNSISRIGSSCGRFCHFNGAARWGCCFRPITSRSNVPKECSFVSLLIDLPRLLDILLKPYAICVYRVTFRQTDITACLTNSLACPVLGRFAITLYCFYFLILVLNEVLKLISRLLSLSEH